MNNKLLTLSLLAIALTSCSSSTSVVESKVFCFDTMVDVKLYQGDKDNVSDIEDILNDYDALADNYQARTVTNVYSLNQTNDEIVVDERLYNLLKTSASVMSEGADYFNPLCGSLAKKWKESLAEGEILSSDVINAELAKISSSSLSFNDENNGVTRTGEAEIDLGGIAKGYVLDEVLSYLNENEITQYLINAGSSSILLGEKNTKDGLFTVGLKDVSDAYIKLSNCFVSTSATSEQGVEIDGVTYSHIINPVTGSAINQNDAVIVISDTGYYGDALSTSMMNNTIDEIKVLEQEHDIKTIVIKDNEIAYCHEGIEVYYH